MGDVVVDALRTLLLGMALHRVLRIGAGAPPELAGAWRWVGAGAALLVLGSLADTLADVLPSGPLDLPLWVAEQVVGYGAGLLLVLWGGTRILADATASGAAAARVRQAEAEQARQDAVRQAEEASRRTAALKAELARANDTLASAAAEARASSRFLARMSHELRQPLTTVVGFSEVLRSEVFGPIGNSRYREYVAGILAASRNLSMRLSDLLDLCTIEAGEMVLHEEPVEPRDLIAGCLQLFGQTALRRGCLLDLDVDERLPPLRADSRRLKQILANLIDDAIERCGDGARITVSAGLAGDGICLTVRDPGLAVDAGGDGRSALGRALARSLAELHQGRLLWRRGADGGNEAELWLPPGRVIEHARALVTNCCDL